MTARTVPESTTGIKCEVEKLWLPETNKIRTVLLEKLQKADFSVVNKGGCRFPAPLPSVSVLSPWIQIRRSRQNSFCEHG